MVNKMVKSADHVFFIYFRLSAKWFTFFDKWIIG